MKNFNLFRAHFGQIFPLSDLSTAVKALWGLIGLYVIFYLHPDGPILYIFLFFALSPSNSLNSRKLLKFKFN